jgi:hypothetical protein
MPQQPTFHLLMKTAVMARKATNTSCRCDPMARNDQGEPVRTASLPDRARRGADSTRDLRIGHNFAARNRGYLPPYFALMLGTDFGHWQCECKIRLLEVSLQLRSYFAANCITWCA